MHAFIVGSRRHQQAMVKALSATKVRPSTDREFALADLAQAFHHEASGKHFGKICITI